MAPHARLRGNRKARLLPDCPLSRQDTTASPRPSKPDCAGSIPVTRSTAMFRDTVDRCPGTPILFGRFSGSPWLSTSQRMNVHQHRGGSVQDAKIAPSKDVSSAAGPNFFEPRCPRLENAAWSEHGRTSGGARAVGPRTGCRLPGSSCCWLSAKLRVIPPSWPTFSASPAEPLQPPDGSAQQRPRHSRGGGPPLALPTGRTRSGGRWGSVAGNSPRPRGRSRIASNRSAP